MAVSYFAGLDPGVTGAVAIVDQDSVYQIGFHCPDGPVEMAKALHHVHNQYPITVACLELVHSFPKQGVVSGFTFGISAGQWQGILSALSISYVLITPTRWQKRVLDSGCKDHLAFARRRWPTAPLPHKKDEAIAAALCLAEYARLTYHGEATQNAI